MRIPPEAYARLYRHIKQYQAEISQIKSDFLGSGVAPFVGRFGYPKVSLGLLAPPAVRQDAWALDAPRFWHATGYNIPSIVEARAQLVHSRQQASVTKPQGKLVELAQELAMSKSTPDMEFHLRSKPQPRFSLDSRTPPIGAPAILERAEIVENPNIPRKVDSIISDELKASEATHLLYEKRIDTNQIVRIFSVGLLGVKPRLVPTRWSITAVDDIVSKEMIAKIKDFPSVNEVFLFHNEYLGNHFEILLLPYEWNFEMIECWMTPKGPSVCQDWERHWGRRDYAADITGAYYSARLGVCEHLEKEKRQASILVLRYIKPEYYLPCGVWVIRETVRGAFSSQPERFTAIESALSKAFSRIPIRSNVMLSRSCLLKELKSQKRLPEFGARLHA